ncbi:MAG TPA: DsbA family protein [Acidimicrobiales bacterium]|nr:DsbA family protein [Acidimicrobiales bacterium]
MDALCWSDYLCPWCYVGQDRTELLASLGVRVTVLPFELHPNIPAGGVERAPSAARYAGPAAEAEELGLPFDPPVRTPNTRRVLEVSEWVRRAVGPDAHARFSALVFKAHFVQHLSIDDVPVLDGLLEAAGVGGGEAWDAVAGGEPSAWVDSSMALAREAGVAGTPAWLVGANGAGARADPDSGFLIPGVQPRPFFQRIIRNMRARTSQK